jgi:hypothetical protein
VVPIARLVLLAVDDPLGELAHVGGVHLRVHGEHHVEAILLHLVDVPLAVRRRPPHSRPPQARERQVGHELVARPAIVHITERHLKLAPLSGLEVLGEDGTLVDLLILGRARGLDVPPINDPAALLSVAPHVLLLSLDGQPEMAGLMAEAHVSAHMRAGARLAHLAPQVVLAPQRLAFHSSPWHRAILLTARAPWSYNQRNLAPLASGRDVGSRCRPNGSLNCTDLG